MVLRHFCDIRERVKWVLQPVAETGELKKRLYEILEYEELRRTKCWDKQVGVKKGPAQFV